MSAMSSDQGKSEANPKIRVSYGELKQEFLRVLAS
jgi:hypothetical protein